MYIQIPTRGLRGAQTFHRQKNQPVSTGLLGLLLAFGFTARRARR